MKKIILIALTTISMSCMGQGVVISDSLTEEEVFVLQYFIMPKDTFVQVSQYVWQNEATWTWIDSTVYYYQLQNTIDLLSRYAEYCYNDSTLLYDWVHYRWNGMEVDTVYQIGQFPLYIESSAKPIKPIYKHKEPTLLGYLEWLNKQLNR